MRAPALALALAMFSLGAPSSAEAVVTVGSGGRVITKMTSTATAAVDRSARGRSKPARAGQYSATVRVRGYGKVRLRRYVERVVAIEWRGQPYELLKAAAVAVRQYALTRGRRVLRPTTSDQIYRVVDVTAKVRRAVAETWTWRLIDRAGNLRFTPYRAGRVESCGYGVDGKRLYAAGARDCAAKGWGAARILRTYYGGRVVR